jgi:hypothetical protein
MGGNTKSCTSPCDPIDARRCGAITKLTAHTLSVALNRLSGAAELLHIKELAFPKPN